MAEIDEKDRHILALLQDDARMPLVAIARAVGLSRSAAQERLRRLERSGVIGRYTIRMADSVPERGVRAWLAIRFAPGRSCAHIVPLLAPLPEIRLLQSVAGPIDLLALAETDSTAALTALRERVNALAGVAGVETTVVLATHLDRL
ncbi:Lrp/AsnC family transcriptional regulator [Arenibaculum pallidiluteum]|uniref:Lrp/AsnC family transcriptional regulator n=1 Tax=Arenibaculum pallidiluteum TaxID=2812559 RepID=UPI001A95B989|nr:Lrp/AsnC family transcriptional regulator [Arenibaculum pallidiluteum]